MVPLLDLRDSGMGTLNPYWACYHTELYDLCADDMRIGVLGCAVGASFASAGQITPIRNPPYFVLIDRALRDEGTSYHC